MPNIDSPPVKMNGRNNSNLVAADIENGQPSHLVGTGKCPPQVHKGIEIGTRYDPMPGSERPPAIGMQSAKFG